MRGEAYRRAEWGDHTNRTQKLLPQVGSQHHVVRVGGLSRTGFGGDCDLTRV